MDTLRLRASVACYGTYSRLLGLNREAFANNVEAKRLTIDTSASICIALNSTHELIIQVDSYSFLGVPVAVCGLYIYGLCMFTGITDLSATAQHLGAIPLWWGYDNDVKSI